MYFDISPFGFTETPDSLIFYNTYQVVGGWSLSQIPYTLHYIFESQVPFTQHQNTNTGWLLNQTDRVHTDTLMMALCLIALFLAYLPLFESWYRKPDERERGITPGKEQPGHPGMWYMLCQVSYRVTHVVGLCAVHLDKSAAIWTSVPGIMLLQNRDLNALQTEVWYGWIQV